MGSTEIKGLRRQLLSDKRIWKVALDTFGRILNPMTMGFGLGTLIAAATGAEWHQCVMNMVIMMVSLIFISFAIPVVLVLVKPKMFIKCRREQ